VDGFGAAVNRTGPPLVPDTPLLITIQGESVAALQLQPSRVATSTRPMSPSARAVKLNRLSEKLQGPEALKLAFTARGPLIKTETGIVEPAVSPAQLAN
jgi:hypothetical protein